MRSSSETNEQLASRFLPTKGGAQGRGFDELSEQEGLPRAHWKTLMDSLARLGPVELAARWENAQRIVREHGVTYNVYGDSQGMDRPWGLDLVPFVIGDGEWSEISKGLIQRSRLFNLVLGDVYGGAQHLLRDGILPPELIYANSGFLRTCRGIPVAHEVYLHLHACDLARSNDGHWWVLSDRTQAPSGAGYALENRSVISRVLPDQIRECGVGRLPDFFRRQREMLFHLAPEGCRTPNVVLLTPGPHNETYFEHAYLARHLGFTLVEGADLTVRNRRVFLKTLEGLQQVDVILRRVDDSFCDPLELRNDSFLGVAGLVEATRAGNVTVANALGSGLLEAPAFMAFMGVLCRHLLGEELLLPSVATWWCGQAKELRYVIEHLEELVIKPAFGPPSRQPWFGGAVTAAERAKMADMILASPREFVGQERASLSRAPVWTENALENRSVVLRSYVAHGGDSIVVMPGGLTRVSRTAEDPIVSMQSGGGSKDTWVLLTEASKAQEPLHAPSELRTVERTSSGVPSRAADNLFWLGRYTERLEQTLRLLRCVIGRLMDETTGTGSAELRALGALLGRLECLGERLPRDFAPADLQRLVLQLVYKVELCGSVRELLGRIRFIASAVRDRFSGDTWRILCRLDLDSRTRAGRLPLTNAQALIQNLILDLSAFNGMEMENMTRGHAWHFLDTGRRAERGLTMLRILRETAALPPQETAHVLEPVLEIADSVMTYRRRYFAEPRLPETLDLLMRDETNPRSLAFQLSRLHDHCGQFPNPGTQSGAGSEQRQIMAMRDILESTSFEEMVGLDNNSGQSPLLRWCDSLTSELASFSDHLNRRYFSHSLPRVS